jgi:hypothetical protein
MIKLLLALMVLFAPVLAMAAEGREYRIEKIMGSWLDVPIETLVNQWGFPAEESTIMGDKRYTWFQDLYASIGFVKKTNKWFCTRNVFVKDDKVWKVETIGNNCPFGAVGNEYTLWAYRPNYKKPYDTSRVKHQSTT